MKDPMKLVITITGDSAEELFAVGHKRLKGIFLPKGLGIKSEDVKACWFEQVLERNVLPTKYAKHKDNIYGKSN